MKIRNRKRALAAVTLSALTALPAAAVHADDTSAEIRLLKARLRQLEDKVAKQDREQKETRAKVANVANAAAPPLCKDGPCPPPPPPVFVTFANGLKVESFDKAFSFKIGGRIFVDGGGSTQPETGKAGNAGIRRARLEVEGRAFAYYFYKLQYDFAGNNVATTAGGATTSPLGGMRDAYLGIEHPALTLPFTAGPLRVMVGNHYEPSSLELVTSSKYIDFIERALPVDAFGGNRHIGASIGGYGTNWSAKLGIYTTSPEDKALAPSANFNFTPWNTLVPVGKTWSPTGGGQYFDLAGRATWAPIKDEGRLLHLGVWGRYHRPNDSTALNDDRVLALGSNLKSEANILGESLVGTPDLSCGVVALYTGAGVAGRCVKDVVGYGAEISGAYGPFSVQAEYMGNHYNRNSSAIALASAYSPLSPAIGLFQPQVASANFDGYYAYATWYLTGESRAEAYDVKDKNTAAFEQIKIKNPVSAGGWGAWELGLRFSSVNLNAGPITGSAYQNLIGLSVLRGNANLVRAVTNSSIEGGRQQDLTAGINWYPDKGFRLMLNWTRVMALSAPFDRPYLNGAHPNIIMMRAQVDW
jgi:phosphate-selective porin OprO/OprP